MDSVRKIQYSNNIMFRRKIKHTLQISNKYPPHSVIRKAKPLVYNVRTKCTSSAERKKAKWMKLGKICSKQTVDTEKCISLMDTKNQAK